MAVFFGKFFQSRLGFHYIKNVFLSSFGEFFRSRLAVSYFKGVFLPRKQFKNTILCKLESFINYFRILVGRVQVTS